MPLSITSSLRMDATSERHLFRLASCQQPLVEVPDSRVVAAGYQRSHVEDGPHRERPPQTARLPRRVPLSRL